MDKPVQRGIVLFLNCSNRNCLVSDSLPYALNRFIHYVLQSTIVLQGGPVKLGRLGRLLCNGFAYI